MEIQSLKDAIQFRDDRFAKIDFIKTKNSVAFMLNFLPDQEMKSHNHPGRELFLHVLEGAGTLLIDGEMQTVKTGDVIHVDADEQIGFVNDSSAKVSISVTMTKRAS